MEEVMRLSAFEGQEINQAKEVLAFEVTKLIHGEEAANTAQADARKAFTSKKEIDVTGDSIPHSSLEASELDSGIGLLTLIVQGKLAASNGEARRLIKGRGVRIHDTVIEDPQYSVNSSDLKDSFVLIRVGKKKLHRFDCV